MEGFIREACIATVEIYGAARRGPARRSIYQNGTCSISPRMAAKHPQTSIEPGEQMDGVSEKGKITMGRERETASDASAFPFPIVRRLVKNAH